jgi:hypothetical protein
LQNEQLWFSCSIIGVKPVAIAQQGKPIYGLKIDFITLKKLLQYYAFKSRFNSCLGPVMTISMIEANVDNE